MYHILQCCKENNITLELPQAKETGIAKMYGSDGNPLFYLWFRYTDDRIEHRFYGSDSDPDYIQDGNLKQKDSCDNIENATELIGKFFERFAGKKCM